MRTVAVVVLNWNGVADTLALLPTLERCRLPEGWRLGILVVDNGSTRGSGEKIRARFPAGEVLALGENRRLAGGNNAGLKRALEPGADAGMLLHHDTEGHPALLGRPLPAL